MFPIFATLLFLHGPSVGCWRDTRPADPWALPVPSWAHPRKPVLPLPRLSGSSSSLGNKVLIKVANKHAPVLTREAGRAHFTRSKFGASRPLVCLPGEHGHGVLRNTRCVSPTPRHFRNTEAREVAELWTLQKKDGTVMGTSPQSSLQWRALARLVLVYLLINETTRMALCSRYCPSRTKRTKSLGHMQLLHQGANEGTE